MHGHALGVQKRQDFLNGISLNATRPAQPNTLGTFEPFHNMAIYDLSEMNKVKIPFSWGWWGAGWGGYSLLDSPIERRWDVKPLCANVADCHFKFLTLLTIYLDKKIHSQVFISLCSELITIVPRIHITIA